MLFLKVQAAEPMAMKVKLQSYKSEEWDNDEDVTEEFFAKFEVLRRYHFVSLLFYLFYLFILCVMND